MLNYVCLASCTRRWLIKARRKIVRGDTESLSVFFPPTAGLRLYWFFSNRLGPPVLNMRPPRCLRGSARWGGRQILFLSRLVDLRTSKPSCKKTRRQTVAFYYPPDEKPSVRPYIYGRELFLRAPKSIDANQPAPVRRRRMDWGVSAGFLCHWALTSKDGGRIANDVLWNSHDEGHLGCNSCAPSRQSHATYEKVADAIGKPQSECVICT